MTAADGPGVLGLPQVLSDPYPLYEAFRQDRPVFVAPLGLWVVTNFADAAAVLRDRRLVAFTPRRWQVSAEPEQEEALRRLEEQISRQMMYLDVNEHTRVRSLVSDLFTPRAVERWRPRIRAVVDELVDDLAREGVGAGAEPDFVATFAARLPVFVVAELLGLGPDRERFLPWARAIARGVDLVLDPDRVVEANEALAGLGTYLRDVIPRRRRRPGDDLLSQLLGAGEEGRRLDVDACISICVQLLGAYETTAGLMSNALVALDRAPEQRARLAADLTLVPNAVEEALRYDSPVQLTSRRAQVTTELCGVTFEAGADIAVVVGAANRDPAEAPRPDVYDVTRPGIKHLALGHGPHVCLGASLARCEAQLALEAVHRRFPRWELVDREVDWRPSITLRCPERLPLRLDPGAGPQGAPAAVNE